MALTSEQISAKNFKEFYDRIYPYLNGAAHAGYTPIGTIISVMGTTAPQNYLACNGQTVNIADYPELAAYFEAQFGTKNHFGGDGTTTLGIPDLRGEFLRGTGTNSHTNQGNGGDVGAHQDATRVPLVQEFYKSSDTKTQISIYASSGSTGNPANNPRDMDKWVMSSAGTNKSSTVALGSMAAAVTSGYEADGYLVRPTNTSVLYCIAVKDIFIDARFEYSLAERVVGTWIDGKPIYQKTVECGALPNAAQKTVAHGITNIDKILYCQGFAVKTADSSITMQFPTVWDTVAYNYIDAFADKTQIYIATGQDRSDYTAYYTLNYTKTA